MDLEFNISNQSVKRVDRKELANYSQEYLQLSFTFKTDDWEGLTKFALFKKDKKAYRVALTNDKVMVPNAVLTGDRFTFMVYGVNNEDVRATTHSTLLYLADSGFTEDVEDDLPDDDPALIEQIYIAIDTAESDAEAYAKEYTDTGLSGKSDVGHTHTKSDVTDFTHTHLEADITDLKDYALSEHNHDTRYYTEDEVDAIISSLEHRIDNHINLTADKTIMQTGDEAEFTAYAVIEGIPVKNQTIYFFEEYTEEEES
jgi:hypothetical protein